jgi:hypothetical protein
MPVRPMLSLLHTLQQYGIRFKFARDGRILRDVHSLLVA